MIPIFEKAHQLVLTDTEKELLNYFENNLPSSAFISLKELGAKLYTSNATIVRFCQKLGLRGYNEFKYQIRHELEQLKEPALSSNSMISHSIALFQDNLESVDITVLETVAQLLTDDRPIYIYGNNLSSLAARYLHTILTTLEQPSILIEWPRLLRRLAHELTGDAILFTISAHGDGKRYLPVFQRLHEQDVCTILLTCQQDSPLIPYSAYAICTNDPNEEYHHVDINGRLGIFTIIQILIELIASKKTAAPFQ